MCRAGAAPVASSSPARRAHSGPGHLAQALCSLSAACVENECCEEYEHCVSCCQAPQHSNASVLQAVFRGPDRRGALCSAGFFASRGAGTACMQESGMGAVALQPAQPRDERRRVWRRRPETGHWGSVFEYCRGKCRTSSKSTVHENAYLSPLHHCFSASGAAPPARSPHAARPCAACHLFCGHGSVRASLEGHRRACAHCMLHGPT